MEKIQFRTHKAADPRQAIASYVEWASSDPRIPIDIQPSTVEILKEKKTPKYYVARIAYSTSKNQFRYRHFVMGQDKDKQWTIQLVVGVVELPSLPSEQNRPRVDMFHQTYMYSPSFEQSTVYICEILPNGSAVASVQITFEDGHVLQDEVEDDLVLFEIVHPHYVASLGVPFIRPIEARLYSASGELLSKQDM
jgi:hypothetical protein